MAGQELYALNGPTKVAKIGKYHPGTVLPVLRLFINARNKTVKTKFSNNRGATNLVGRGGTFTRLFFIAAFAFSIAAPVDPARAQISDVPLRCDDVFFFVVKVCEQTHSTIIGDHERRLAQLSLSARVTSVDYHLVLMEGVCIICLELYARFLLLYDKGMCSFRTGPTLECWVYLDKLRQCNVGYQELTRISTTALYECYQQAFLEGPIRWPTLLFLSPTTTLQEQPIQAATAQVGSQWLVIFGLVIAIGGIAVFVGLLLREPRRVSVTRDVIGSLSTVARSDVLPASANIPIAEPE